MTIFSKKGSDFIFYITGDTHGNFERIEKWTKGKTLTKKDFLLVLGDFGIWDHTKERERSLDRLNELPFTILFISGNHSNYDILDSLPDCEWNGGKVNYIRDSILHLKRGYVFTVNGYRFFTFGGAESHDIRYGILDPDDPLYEKKKQYLQSKKYFFRIKGLTWWERELPDLSEIELARQNLSDANNYVHFIFTHCTSSIMQNNSMFVESLPYHNIYPTNILTDFFDEIEKTVTFGMWCFGHYHINKTFDRKHNCVYDQIIPLF